MIEEANDLRLRLAVFGLGRLTTGDSKLGGTGELGEPGEAGTGLVDLAEVGVGVAGGLRVVVVAAESGAAGLLNLDGNVADF